MRRTFSMVVACVLALAPASGAFAQADGAGRPPTKAEVTAALGSSKPRAVAMYDPATGRFLYGKNVDVKLPVASLMKMVTALVVSERLDPRAKVRISQRAATAPHDRILWPAGKTFTADQVMHGMLLESSNGAAIALAEKVSGSVEAFGALASETLALYGITETALVDPSGLDAQGQYSTASDMSRVSAAVLRTPWLAKIVRKESFTLRWVGKQRATFRTINRYLVVDPTSVGVKTGYTRAAGDTVAAAATRGGRTHIVVVLGGSQIVATTERLMDLAFRLAPGPAPTSPPPPLKAGAPPSAGLATDASLSAGVRLGPPATPAPGQEPMLFALALVLYAATLYRKAWIQHAGSTRTPAPATVPVAPAASAAASGEARRRRPVPSRPVTGRTTSPGARPSRPARPAAAARGSSDMVLGSGLAPDEAWSPFERPGRTSSRRAPDQSEVVTGPRIARSRS